MIPSTNTILSTDIEIKQQASLNYKMQMVKDIILGKCDKLEAMKQVVFKILNTERYQYVIYSWNYGIELLDLFGMPVDYVCAELIDRITEALVQDDRINSVSDFDFTFPNKGEILATFTVHTIFGDIEAERQVTI